MSTYTNKREHILALISAGGATKESLMEATGTSDKSLASSFALMRLEGNCPIKGADGFYAIVSKDEYSAMRSERAPAAARVALSPLEVKDAAQKREDRASKILTTMQKRAADAPNRKNELRLIIAEAELELSSILLGDAQAAYQAADADTRDVVKDKGKGKGKKTSKSEGTDLVGDEDDQLV